MGIFLYFCLSQRQLDRLHNACQVRSHISVRKTKQGKTLRSKESIAPFVMRLASIVRRAVDLNYQLRRAT